MSRHVCVTLISFSTHNPIFLLLFRYAASRLCVGISGKSDAPILSYKLHIDALTPAIATAYVFNSAVSTVKEKFAQLHQKPLPSAAASHNNDVDPFPTPTPPGLAFEVMVLALALKPALAWHAVDVANQVRELTGGQGYLSCNYFGELIGFAHAGLTAEGDSKVLWMKVTKELLSKEKVNETMLLTSSIKHENLKTIVSAGIMRPSLADKIISILGMCC